MQYFDVNDLGLSDYEDELDDLRVVSEPDEIQHEPHPLSDLNLMQLVGAA